MNISEKYEILNTTCPPTSTPWKIQRLGFKSYSGNNTHHGIFFDPPYEVIEILRLPDFKLRLVDDSRDDAKLLLYRSDIEVPPWSSPWTPKALSDLDRFLNEFDDLLDSRLWTLALGSWQICRWFLCLDEFCMQNKQSLSLTCLSDLQLVKTHNCVVKAHSSLRM